MTYLEDEVEKHEATLDSKDYNAGPFTDQYSKGDSEGTSVNQSSENTFTRQLAGEALSRVFSSGYWPDIINFIMDVETYKEYLQNGTIPKRAEILDDDI